MHTYCQRLVYTVRIIYALTGADTGFQEGGGGVPITVWDWSLITGRGWGVYTMGVKFYRYKKKKGGGGKRFSHAEGNNTGVDPPL